MASEAETVLVEDYEKALSIAKILRDQFSSKTGFFKDYSMPEYLLPKSVVSGSREHALYLTYVISIDYQTNAVKLWSNARALHMAHPECFEPKNIMKMDNQQLEEIIRNLGARYASNGASAWKRISEILLSRFDGDPRNITSQPVSISHAKRTIDVFPHLRGKKLSNFYIRTMGETGLFKLSDLQDLDIAVDVQVARFTFYTGCLQPREGRVEGCVHEDPIRPAIEKVWRTAAKKLGIAPWQLDEPIWAIGSSLCSARNCHYCPVEEVCKKNFDATLSNNRLYWQK